MTRLCSSRRKARMPPRASPCRQHRPAPSRPRPRQPVPPPPSHLLSLDPIPTLISRVRPELGVHFAFGRSLRFSRAPGRLDVMGGIADYTGSLVCELPLDRAVGLVLQERNDRELQVFSFNLYDEHQPFTFRMPLLGLAT